MPEQLPFVRALAARRQDPKLRKGERTRIRLMTACAALLNESRFHDVRVSDICQGAGVSQGVFYLYAQDKRDIATDVLKAFVEYAFQRLDERDSLGQDLEHSVYSATLAYIELFATHKGLMYCLMQPSDPAFQPIFSELNTRWNLRVAEALARRRGAGSADSDDVLTAYALGGMADEFLTNLHIRRDPVLLAAQTTNESIARLLTRLWLRAATPTQNETGKPEMAELDRRRGLRSTRVKKTR